MAGWLAQLLVGSGDVEKVIGNLEDHAECLTELGERIDHRSIEVGDEAPDAGGGGEQRCRLAADAGEVTGFWPGRVVRVTQLFDLTFAQTTDGAGQQTCNFSAQRRSDLRGARQQEVTGENRLQVAPLRVHGLDTAPGVGFVHHVVVIERPGLYQLAGDAALHCPLVQRSVGGAGDLSCDHCENRSQALATGNDQVRGDVVEIRVGCVHRLLQRSFDTRKVACMACQREQRHGRHVGRPLGRHGSKATPVRRWDPNDGCIPDCGVFVSDTSRDASLTFRAL